MIMAWHPSPLRDVMNLVGGPLTEVNNLQLQCEVRTYFGSTYLCLPLSNPELHLHQAVLTRVIISAARWWKCLTVMPTMTGTETKRRETMILVKGITNSLFPACQ